MTAVLEQVELPIQGMTCASCASRIERKLNELDGVTATVNYATEKARVISTRARVSPEELLAAVEAVGYTATLRDRGIHGVDEPAHETRRLRTRLIVSALLSVPILLMSMVPRAAVR